MRRNFAIFTEIFVIFRQKSFLTSEPALNRSNNLLNHPEKLACLHCIVSFPFTPFVSTQNSLNGLKISSFYLGEKEIYRSR